MLILFQKTNPSHVSFFFFLNTDKDRRKMAHNFLAQTSLIGINK